jgi:hypothetical protein
MQQRNYGGQPQGAVPESRELIRPELVANPAALVVVQPCAYIPGNDPRLYGWREMNNRRTNHSSSIRSRKKLLHDRRSPIPMLPSKIDSGHGLLRRA